MTDKHDFLFTRAAFKRPIKRTPVWVMRQAGRYLPEYRKVREKAGCFLDLCMNPDYATEVSIQPLDIIGVDAVIMFSDILTPLLGMGIDLDFTPGPVVGNPIRSEQDINALSIPDPDTSTGYVGKLLRNLRQEVNGRVPIIGFAGAPFTLACYLVEGGNSKLFSQVTRLFLNHPRQARKLTRKLTTMTINYLNYQIENGARVIQLFDTWAGILSLDDYREFVFPYIVEIFDSLHQKGEVPTIYYINGGNHLLSIMAETGADVISLDWRSDIGETKQLIGDRVALQGNLDPNTLFCDPDVIENRVRRVLEKYGSDSGHIFNLGHGIDKNVDPERLRIMVSAVKKFSVRQ